MDIMTNEIRVLTSLYSRGPMRGVEIREDHPYILRNGPFTTAIIYLTQKGFITKTKVRDRGKPCLFNITAEGREAVEQLRRFMNEKTDSENFTQTA